MDEEKSALMVAIEKEFNLMVEDLDHSIKNRDAYLKRAAELEPIIERQQKAVRELAKWMAENK